VASFRPFRQHLPLPRISLLPNMNIRKKMAGSHPKLSAVLPEWFTLLSYRAATPQGVPPPIPVEPEIGVLKLGKTIHWIILRFADNGLKCAIWGG
jgi:hypothetical protein